MKRFLSTAILAVALLSSAAEARDYQLLRGVIAQISTGGGFVHPSAPTAVGVRIFDNGQVVSFREYSNSRSVGIPIARLTIDKVRAITASLASLPSSELVKSDPHAQMCMDAPTTTYLGRNGAGAAIALKGIINCIVYVRADGAHSELNTILDGFQALAFMP